MAYVRFMQIFSPDKIVIKKEKNISDVGLHFKIKVRISKTDLSGMWAVELQMDPSIIPSCGETMVLGQ